MCVWGLLGVGGRGTGDSYGGKRDVLSTVLRRAGVPLSQGDRGGGGGAGLATAALWPGAFLSIFMECKRSFLFYFVFFVKLKQTKKSTSST